MGLIKKKLQSSMSTIKIPKPNSNWVSPPYTNGYMYYMFERSLKLPADNEYFYIFARLSDTRVIRNRHDYKGSLVDAQEFTFIGSVSALYNNSTMFQELITFSTSPKIINITDKNMNLLKQLPYTFASPYSYSFSKDYTKMIRSNSNQMIMTDDKDNLLQTVATDFYSASSPTCFINDDMYVILEGGSNYYLYLKGITKAITQIPVNVQTSIFQLLQACNLSFL